MLLLSLLDVNVVMCVGKVVFVSGVNQMLISFILVMYIKHNVQCNDTTLLTQTCEHHINYISTGYWDADNTLA